MKKFLIIAGILILSGAAVALAMGDMFKRGTWRYEMTITVETPEGVKSGSAVREVIVQRQPDILPDVAAANASVRGEAVVVDLGKRGVLFAPLGGDSAYMIVFKAFPYRYGGFTPEGIGYYEKLEAKAPLKPENYPKLVTFTDLSDPKTIEPVDPDNPAAVFGEGVSLKEITIEMTEKPVVLGLVDKYLPSFDEETGFWEWYKTLNYGDPRRFTPADFR